MITFNIIIILYLIYTLEGITCRRLPLTGGLLITGNDKGNSDVWNDDMFSKMST